MSYAVDTVYTTTTDRHPHGVTFVSELSNVPASLRRIERLASYPSQQDLLRLFDYNAATGELRWKVRAGSRAPAGSGAGAINSGGYRTIKIEGVTYYAHGLAWIIKYGVRAQSLDHIDLNGCNNKLDNLRLCTNSQNQHNKPVPSTNKSGYAGVSYERKKQKWRAYIRISSKGRHLGYFDSAELAAARYRAEAVKLHGEFLHASLSEAA
jgi:HNH endonuclease/AP2 domain